MNLIAVVLVLALIAAPAYGESLPKKKSTQSFFERLFQPKPKPTPHAAKSRKHATKPRPQSTPPPSPTPIPSPQPTRSKSGAYIVDSRWMAYYWEQELAWGYPIPEDRDIQFIDGEYHVPIVVYRHYEDMVNASASRN